MNISELVGAKLPEIKKLLFSENETPEVTTEAFEDAKLVDGSIVRIEPAVEVGATVVVIGEDGETVPAPDAAHELESGVIIRTEGGVVVEVLEPEAAPEEEAPEEVEEEMAEVPAFDADAFKEDILGAVSNLIKSEIDAAAFASAKKVDEVTEAVSLVTDIMEKMASTPKEAPTKKVSNPFNKGVDYTDLAAKISAVMKEQNN
tara:strand:- start:16717 stop:17325 length:609 start_codon:yes stop_codon:yes gene_type:complete